MLRLLFRFQTQLWKSRDTTLLIKVCMVRAMIFTIVMYRWWKLGHKECWVPKNWCFTIVVLEKILESLLDYREIKPVNPKGNQSLMLKKLKLQYVGHLIWRTDSFEKTLMLGKIEGRRRRGQALGVDDEQGGLMCCTPWGHKEFDKTELNWTDGPYSLLLQLFSSPIVVNKQA